VTVTERPYAPYLLQRVIDETGKQTLITYGPTITRHRVFFLAKPWLLIGFPRVRFEGETESLVRFRGLARYSESSLPSLPPTAKGIKCLNAHKYSGAGLGVTTKDAIRQTKTALLTSSEKGRTERERWMMVHAIDSLYRVPEAIHITSISARQTLTWPN
jgi:hypothetical protein